jgi:transposase
LVLCVAVDRHGWPVAWEVFPGNTADKVAFVKVIGTLRNRFKIRNIVVVADRGMLSSDTLKLLADHSEAPFDFIIGCRMRKQKEVSETVLGRAGRFKPVADNLEVKEVDVDGRRYIVCRNPEVAKKDAAARQALLDKLEAKLAHSPKALIGNKGYKRFLKMSRGAIKIDQAAVQSDARLDGKFVLRTNTDLPADEVALTYKSLWRVERTFREEKSTLEVRPIYHHCDGNSVGHIVAAFLALRLEVDLQRRLDDAGVDVSWPDLMRDLSRVQAVYLDLDGKPYRVRTDLGGSAYKALRAAGVKPPSRVSPCKELPRSAMRDECALNTPKSGDLFSQTV